MVIACFHFSLKNSLLWFLCSRSTIKEVLQLFVVWNFFFTSVDSFAGHSLLSWEYFSFNTWKCHLPLSWAAMCLLRNLLIVLPGFPQLWNLLFSCSFQNRLSLTIDNLIILCLGTDLCGSICLRTFGPNEYGWSFEVFSHYCFKQTICHVSFSSPSGNV